jgi:hydroxymethylpyrimidine pyrophosphatase-like HAD family hydrolase
VRMVACDLDGTVVRADGTVSARTLAAFDACERAGVDVVFVTGRPPRWLPPIADVTGHRGLAVCANGALVVDLTSFGVVRVTPLPPAAVLEVADRLRAKLPGAVFALETLDGVRREPGFMPRHEHARAARTGTLPELLAGDPGVVKLLCRQDPLPRRQRRSADELLEIARVELAGIAEPVHSDPWGAMLEIAAPGVSKASGLAGLAAERGIDAADVVAFGDMPNDVPMLRWAGRGYAMSGGHPEAVEAAGRVAPPCEDDGVAQVVEDLLSRLVTD